MSSSAAETAAFLSSLQGMEGLTPEDIAGLRAMVLGGAPVELPDAWEKESGAEEAAEDRRRVEMRTSSALRGAGDESDEFRDLRSKLPTMRIPDKIKLALFGNALCRVLLVQDPSRIVQSAVLKSPRIKEGEVEAFAKNPNVPELVLREISKNRNWMKSYAVKFSLVANPKTAGDIALKWLHFLVKADLRKIANSKNLSQLVTVNARKLLADTEKKGK